MFCSSVLAKKLMIRGGVEDMRNAVLSMAHIQTASEDPTDSDDIAEKVISDLDFFFRLNHTRLVTSRLTWRPDFKQELMVSPKMTIGDFLVFFHSLMYDFYINWKVFWLPWLKMDVFDS